MSIGFSYYLQNFANYEAVYGSLDAIIGFMMWTWISVIILIVGAQINAEMAPDGERQDHRVAAADGRARRGRRRYRWPHRRRIGLYERKMERFPAPAVSGTWHVA